jgi:hypothetical protein
MERTPINIRLMCRTFAAAFLGLIIGSFVHHVSLGYVQHGREAYLVFESHQFDKIMQRTAAGTIFRVAVIVMVFLGFYELIVRGFIKMFTPSKSDSHPAKSI